MILLSWCCRCGSLTGNDGAGALRGPDEGLRRAGGSSPCTPHYTILLILFMIILSACAAEGTDKRFHGLKENVKKGRRRKLAFSPAFFSFSRMQSIRMAAVCRLPVEANVILFSHRETVCFFRLTRPEVGSRDAIPGSGYRGRGAPCLR